MKLKKSVKIILVIVILLIITIFVTKRVLYTRSYEYKLLEIGYLTEETKTLQDKLNNEKLDIILEKEYNPLIVKLILEKYFIFNNLDRYIDFQLINEDETLSNVVALVNVNRDRDYYEDINKSDYSKNYLMIVNKYHGLDESYIPSDVVVTSGVYSYANNFLNQVAYDAFKKLHQDAKKEGFTILINSSYRDYKSQDDLWKAREDLYGAEKADDFAARAGHSEHQTAYAIDVSDFYDVKDTFGNTEAFIWMSSNSYKYGYILRYPKEKENITGYLYEPWHYRYVGIDVAKKIHDEDITFDEYYAYYIENNNN